MTQIDDAFNALLGNDDEYRATMERARMEAWRHISPMSNLHSGCNETCFDPSHYPDGDPLDGADDPEERTTRQREYLRESCNHPAYAIVRLCDHRDNPFRAFDKCTLCNAVRPLPGHDPASRRLDRDHH